MKKLFIALSIFAATSAAAQIQQDSEGNFYEVKKEVAAHDSTTTRTLTKANGEIVPVYVGKKGAHYIAAFTSKGYYYRKYLHSGTAVIGHESGVKN